MLKISKDNFSNSEILGRKVMNILEYSNMFCFPK
jgi:hypothetical protein